MKKHTRVFILFTLIAAVFVGISACKKKVEEPLRTHLNPKLSYGEVKDIDGNKYATISIGNQIWMAENLRTTRYSNGDTIPNLREYWKWYQATSGGWSNYNNDSNLDVLHGRLYNWYAVSDSRNVCPTGWHVPNDAEWKELEEFLGGPDKAGPKLKSAITGYWSKHADADPATNESGFSALPSGERVSYGDFGLMTYRGAFWSETEYEHNTNSAYWREIFWNGNVVGRFNEYKYYGACIRCLKN